MEKQRRVGWKNNRGAGDFPILIVALGGALVVIMLVAIFLVVLPNRKTMSVLKGRHDQLSALISEREALLSDLQKSHEDMAAVEASVEAFRQTLIQNPDDLKTLLPATLVKNGFKADPVEIGISQAGVDEWWLSYPVKFSVTGPQAKFQKAIQAWRDDFPRSVRLEGVDLKKIDAKNNIRAWFMSSAQFLIPEEQLAERFNVETPGAVSPMPLPPPGFMEGRAVKDMRQRITEMEGQVVRQDQMVGALGVLGKKKARLMGIQEQGAQFAASHEREFHTLETQLKSVLGKLNQKDTVQIVLKVQEEEVQKSPQAADPGSPAEIAQEK